MTVEVGDVPEAKRYEARVDGESKVAGVAEYIRTAELVAFVHTEVEAEYEGAESGPHWSERPLTRLAPRISGCWPPVPSSRGGSAAIPSTGTCCTRLAARSATEVAVPPGSRPCVEARTWPPPWHQS